MYRIIKKEELTPLVYLMELNADRIASSTMPGQFLIVRPSENGERTPLTICDYNREKGSVTIVTQIVGVSSDKICKLAVGDSFTDVVGPLGQPSAFVKLADEEIKKLSYVFVAGGVGAAPVYPQAKKQEQTEQCPE